MARVSISEAARLAGVNRGTLYKNYLNKGVISVSKDEGGKKYIDTSELLRVFGSLHRDKNEQQDSEQEQPASNTSRQLVTDAETAKDVEIRMLREQLSKSESREQWLQEKIDTLSDTVKLLESPKHPRLWYQFWK